MASGKAARAKKKTKVYGLLEVGNYHSISFSDYFSNIYHVDCSKRNISDVVKEILKRNDRQSDTRFKSS